MSFFSESGQGLTQVLVAGGLMAAIGAGVSSMIVSQGKEISRLEAKQEAIDLKNGLAMTLSGGGCCPIGNTKVGDISYSEGTERISFTKFFKKCPNDMLKADQVPVHLSSGDGSATHLRSLAIKQMRLESISQVSKGSSDRYTANLIIDVESKSNKYPIKNIMLPINFDASYAAGKKSGTKYISSCVSTSGGGEEGQYPGSGVIVYPSINAGRVDPYSAKGFDAPLSGFNEKKAVFIVPNGVRTLAMELIGGAKSDGAKGSPNPGDKCYGVCKVSSGEKCQIVITEGTTIKNKNYVAPPEGAKYVNFQDGTTDAKIGTFKDEYIPGSTSISCDSGCSASVGTTATSSNIDAFSCVAGGAGASPGHLIMRW